MHGAAARFGEITHLARLDGHPDPKLAGRCVLVDRLNNRNRCKWLRW